MKRLSEQQRKQRQEWITHTTDLASNPEVHATEFERLLDRLDLTEANCHESEECVTWVKAHKDSRFVPERILRLCHARCIYDESTAPYSLIDNMVIPDAPPLQQEGDDGSQTQNQAA